MLLLFWHKKIIDFVYLRLKKKIFPKIFSFLDASWYISSRFVLFYYCEFYIVSKKNESLNELCIQCGNIWKCIGLLLLFHSGWPSRRSQNFIYFFLHLPWRKVTFEFFEYLIVQSTKMNCSIESIRCMVNISSNVLSSTTAKNIYNKTRINNNQRETNSNGIQNYIFGSFSEKE